MEVPVPSKLVNQERWKKSSTRDTAGFFNDDEFEVAEILLKLPQLIIAREKENCVFQSSWSVKKKRSAINLSPSPPHHPPSPSPSPSPSRSTLLPDSCNGSKSSLKVVCNGPETLLSFSPSESDSKPVVVFKKKKMTKQGLLQIVEKLTENIRILKQEIPKARAHYENLKRTNSMLKKIEKKLSSSEQNLNSSRKPLTGPALEEFTSQASSEEEEEGVFRLLKQEEAEVGRLTSGSRTSVSYSSKESNGLGLAKQLSTIDLSDLNLSMESSFGIDSLRLYDLHKVAIGAQARKKRIEINRNKSSMASVKPHDLHKAAIAARARKKRMEINRNKSSMTSIKPRCR